MKLNDLRVVRIAPQELPDSCLFQLNYIYHTDRSQFTVMYEHRGGILMVNSRIPEDDVNLLVQYASFEGSYINNDENEGGLSGLGDYIYDKYGEYTWRCLMDAYKSRQKAVNEARAAVKAKVILPVIKEAYMNDNLPNVYDAELVENLFSAGMRTESHGCGNFGLKYVFYLGYLTGTGRIGHCDIATEGSAT